MSSNIDSQMVSYVVVVLFVFTVSSQDPQTESPYSHLIKHDGDWYEISYHPRSALYKFFFTTKKTFDNAQAKCVEEGANLVSIHENLDLHILSLVGYLAPQERVSISAS